MAGSYASLLYHIVFSTRARQSWLVSPAVRERLWEYMGGVLRNCDCAPLKIGGTADHVHVLCSIGRTQAVADAVRDLKANSSRWLREEFPEMAGFAWQEGYAAFSIGVSGIERSVRYIEGQEERHRGLGFQEELVWFLERHGIEYDPARLRE